MSFLSPAQRRFLLNVERHSGLRVDGVMPRALENRGLIVRDGNSWEVTGTGRLALALQELEGE